MMSIESQLTEPCLLLRLPREIRDSIYDYLLQRSRFSFLDSFHHPNQHAVRINLVYDAQCDARDLSYCKLPQWLLLCKQIQSEGLEQLYRRARCTSYETNRHYGCTSPDLCSTVPPGQLLRLDLVQNLNYDTDIASPSKETSHNTWRAQAEPSDRDHATIVPAVSEMEASSVDDQMLNYLISKPQHRVRQMKFCLCLPATTVGTISQKIPRSIESYDWYVDLSYFQKLRPCFDRVVFRLVCPFSADLKHQKLNTILYPKFQDEIARVAKYLVGGDDEDSGTKSSGSGWVLRDCLKQIQHPKSRRLVSGGYEWHLEASRHGNKRCEEIHHKGLKYCRKYQWRRGFTDFDYFEPADEKVEGMIIWTCKKTGASMRLRCPETPSGVQVQDLEEIYSIP